MVIYKIVYTQEGRYFYCVHRKEGIFKSSSLEIPVTVKYIFRKNDSTQNKIFPHVKDEQRLQGYKNTSSVHNNNHLYEQLKERNINGWQRIKKQFDKIIRNKS